ncbi:hypothetical protein F8S13_09600 [Chloroflexia bacterium SDU3-3]|nr:hypothetical protein F8S13_09600 [Chloroflexia bacterium SDU3-3]
MDQLLDIILASSEGRAGFPISLCDFSDPFIPAHRERVLAILQALIDRGAQNLVYITTKVHPGMRFLRRLRALLAQPNGLRVTVFVSLPPLREGYERASVPGRVRLLQDLVALGIPCCWYLRPLTEDWYDEELLTRLAHELLPHVSHHVILSGIVMSAEVEAVLQDRGLVVPTWDHGLAGRKQHLSPKFEHHVRTLLATIADELGVAMGPVMGHRLCGTNGNHAYGCLLCARQDRYCQHFQVQQFGTTIQSVNSPHLQRLLQRQREEMKAARQQPALLPSEEECS